MSLRMKTEYRKQIAEARRKNFFWQKGPTDDRVTLILAKKHRKPHPHPPLPLPRRRVRVGGKISPTVNSNNANQEIIFGVTGLRNSQTLQSFFCSDWVKL